MSFMLVTNKGEMRELLPRLKAATVPGRTNDGTKLMVTYKAFNPASARALQEAELAREEGWNLREYTGTLDRVFRNARGELCFTMLVLERTSGGGHHAYRSFNTMLGDLSQLVVMGVNQPNSQRAEVHAQPQKPD